MKLILGLLLCFCPVLMAKAQENPNRYREIRQGQSVPSVAIAQISGLRLQGRTVHALNLDELHGKLVILDFWATWCSPCRAMVPVMDSLQRKFDAQVQFISVTYQHAAEIQPVLREINHDQPGLPQISDDTLLHRLFPHRTLPHYVWISPDGKLLATTGMEEINAGNIRAALRGNTAMRVKRDSVARYDGLRPLFAAGNGGDGTTLRYHSLLSGFTSGLSSGTRVTPFDPVRGQLFTVRNVPLIWLYRFVYGDHGWFPESRTRILSKDSAAISTHLEGRASEDWAQVHGWCYELFTPPALASHAYAMMQEDLRRLFPQFTVRIDSVKTTCLALVRTDSLDHLRSKGGETAVAIAPYRVKLTNAHLSQLMMRLEKQYLQNSPLPLVDLTGYTGRVDLDLSAHLWDVASLNQALSAYGLALAQRQAIVPMLVIGDAH